MATTLTTRVTPGLGATVKGALLTNAEVDNNFLSLNINKLERGNNLSDLVDIAAARTAIDVPTRSGGQAFGTWNIAINGNAASASVLQTSRTINGVAFNGSSNIIIRASTTNDLIFGKGIEAPDNFDGSVALQIKVDEAVVVTTVDDQVIDGNKTIQRALVLGTQATATNHAVRADRTLNNGSGISPIGNLAQNRTISVDATVVRTFGNQSINGDKEFIGRVIIEDDVRTLELKSTAGQSIQFNTGGVAANAFTSMSSTGSGRTLSLESEGDFQITIDSGNTQTDRVFKIGRNSKGSFSGSDELLRVQENGNVGIGTNTPTERLHVNGKIRIGTQATSDFDAVRADRTLTGGDGIQAIGNLTANRTVNVDDTVIRTTGNQILGGTKTFTNAVVLNTAGSTTSHAVRGDRELIAGTGLAGGGNLASNVTLTLQNIASGSTSQGAVYYNGTSRSAGRFYGGTTNPNATTRLNYNGNLHVNELHAVGNITAFSDERLKTNIEVIPDALNKVLSVRGVTFTRIDTENKEERHTGVIAQEIEKVLPEVVSTLEDGTKTVAYGNIIGLLIESIKELNEKIERLEGVK
jgi:hypothetical protein